MATSEDTKMAIDIAATKGQHQPVETPVTKPIQRLTPRHRRPS